MTTETLKPEVGTTADLARFDVATAEVQGALAILAEIPTPTDPASRQKLYNALADAAKMKAVIDKRRLELTAPLRERVEAINAYAQDQLIKPMEAKIAERKKEILAYDAEQERLKQVELARIRAEQEAERKKAEEVARKLREEAEAEARRIAEEERKKREAEAEKLKGIARVKALKEAEERERIAKEAAAKAAAEAESKAAIEASVTQAELRNQAEDLEAKKSKGAGKVWAWEVVDIANVPREFLVIDPAAVTAQVRAGTRDIFGIRIFQKDSLALR